MKFLLLIGHENPASLSHSLMAYTRENLEAKGHEVMISDLYKQQFNPVAGKADFLFKTEGGLHYLDMQLKASAEKKFAPDILNEMIKVEQSNAVIIFFPMWWYSYPAIIKGWFDRVLANGFAYGGSGGSYASGNLKNKLATAVITLDGKKKNFTTEGKYKQDINETLYPLMHGTLRYTGFKTLEPFLVYESSGINSGSFPMLLSELNLFLENFTTLFQSNRKVISKEPRYLQNLE